MFAMGNAPQEPVLRYGDLRCLQSVTLDAELVGARGRRIQLALVLGRMHPQLTGVVNREHARYLATKCPHTSITSDGVASERRATL